MKKMIKIAENKNFKPDKARVKLEFQRVPNVKMLEFVEPLTKADSDKVGEIMFAYEQEKQRLLARLAELNDTQVLNSHIAGKPLGIIIPESDLELVKAKLENI